MKLVKAIQTILVDGRYSRKRNFNLGIMMCGRMRITLIHHQDLKMMLTTVKIQGPYSYRLAWQAGVI